MSTAIVIGFIGIISVGTGILLSSLRNLTTAKAIVGATVLLGLASIAAAVALLQ